MGSLALTRKENEAIHLSIAPDAVPANAMEHLRVDIYIDAAQIKGRQVRPAIEAPDILLVPRGGLLHERA
ncbi:hypothetical protein D3C76_1516440 [compost metagenome]